jgi:hypothetical protein
LEHLVAFSAKHAHLNTSRSRKLIEEELTHLAVGLDHAFCAHTTRNLADLRRFEVLIQIQQLGLKVMKYLSD